LMSSHASSPIMIADTLRENKYFFEVTILIYCSYGSPSSGLDTNVRSGLDAFGLKNKNTARDNMFGTRPR
jgi:hypothetical protein